MEAHRRDGDFAVFFQHVWRSYGGFWEGGWRWGSGEWDVGEGIYVEG